VPKLAKVGYSAQPARRAAPFGARAGGEICVSIATSVDGAGPHDLFAEGPTPALGLAGAQIRCRRPRPSCSGSHSCRDGLPPAASADGSLLTPHAVPGGGANESRPLSLICGERLFSVPASASTGAPWKRG